MVKCVLMHMHGSIQISEIFLNFEEGRIKKIPGNYLVIA